MAYTYRIEDNFRSGVPQTAFLNGAGPFRGISCHWTAGAPGRNGALGTVQFFIDRADRNASYHEIWWWENKTFGVMRVVRPERASHSMNPTPPTWSPTALVRRILGTKVGDPNRYSYSVSFAGMPADFERAMTDPDFVHGMARRTRELYAQFGSLAADPLFNHGEGQPATRYDWGTVARPKIYAALNAPEDDDMYEWVSKMTPAKFRATVLVGVPIRTAPLSSDATFAFNMPNSGRTIDFIGMVPDLGGGTIPYAVYVLGSGGLRVTRSDNFEGGMTPLVPEGSGTSDPELEATIQEQAAIIAGQKTDIATLGLRVTKKDAMADTIISNANALKGL
jgi:hypothetical protein